MGMFKTKLQVFVENVKALFVPKELTVADKLNRLFAKHYKKYFIELQKDNLIHVNKGVGNRYEIPYVSLNGDGLTIADGQSSAFMLNDPAYIDQTYAESKLILQRVAFSYEFCLRIIDNEAEFKRVFDKIVPLLVNQVEKQVYQPVGPVPVGSKVYGSAYMLPTSPGALKRGEYFMEMQTRAGYELRIYADIADLNYETITNKPDQKSSKFSSFSR